MKYQNLETKSGIVTIKDAEEPELEGLVNIYKLTFKRHIIFERTPEKILEYLKKAHKENSAVGGGYIIARLGNKTIGGLLLRKKGENSKKRHTLWIYNHIALSGDHSRQGIGTALMNAAEQKIKGLIKKGKIKTAKIEIGVSENEKDALEFYKRFGFESEGKLKSHFRLNEFVYLLGKEIK